MLTLLSARGTPIARRFEIWDASSAATGSPTKVILKDGICEKEGALWDEEDPRTVFAWRGVIGRALGSGLPVISESSVETAGYGSVVAMPIHKNGGVSHVVAWYC